MFASHFCVLLSYRPIAENYLFPADPLTDLSRHVSIPLIKSNSPQGHKLKELQMEGTGQEGQEGKEEMPTTGQQQEQEQQEEQEEQKAPVSQDEAAQRFAPVAAAARKSDDTTWDIADAVFATCHNGSGGVVRSLADDCSRYLITEGIDLAGSTLEQWGRTAQEFPPSKRTYGCSFSVYLKSINRSKDEPSGPDLLDALKEQELKLTVKNVNEFKTKMRSEKNAVRESAQKKAVDELGVARQRKEAAERARTEAEQAAREAQEAADEAAREAAEEARAAAERQAQEADTDVRAARATVGKLFSETKAKEVLAEPQMVGETFSITAERAFGEGAWSMLAIAAATAGNPEFSERLDKAVQTIVDAKTRAHPDMQYDSRLAILDAVTYFSEQVGGAKPVGKAVNHIPPVTDLPIPDELAARRERRAA